MTPPSTPHKCLTVVDKTSSFETGNMAQQSVVAGVRTDCEALITAFRDTNSLRYKDFADLWRAKNMSFIFCGREDDRELCTFIEESLAIAKNLWLSRHNDDPIKKMGGFYLVYAFYMKQPVKTPLKIRLTLNDWDACMLFISYVIENSHTDALYIFRSMLRNHAFHFVYLPAELHPRSSLTQQDSQPTDEEFRFQDRLLEYTKDASFKQFSTFHKRYHEMKSQIITNYFADQPGSLAMSDCNLMQQIEDLTDEYTKNIKSCASVSSPEEQVVKEQRQESSEEIGSRRVQMKNDQFVRETKSKHSSPHKHRLVEIAPQEKGESTSKRYPKTVWRKTVIKGSESEDSSDSS